MAGNSDLNPSIVFLGDIIRFSQREQRFNVELPFL